MKQLILISLLLFYYWSNGFSQIINSTKLLYKIPDYSIKELKDTIDYLELFYKDNSDFKIINLLKNNDIEVVAINDLTDSASLVHLFKYDSAQGTFEGTVELSEE